MSLKGLKINSDLHRRLKRLAADSGSIQQIAEGALEAHLAMLDGSGRKTVLPQNDVLLRTIGAILPESGSDVTGPERGFLSECLAVYRSTFGNALRENVKWFRVGMDAVAKLESLERDVERGGNQVSSAPGALEQGVSALLDHQENEADLLKKAALDAGKKLPGDNAAHPADPKRAEPGQQRSPRKTGGGR
jgi:hypothetical protein